MSGAKNDVKLLDLLRQLRSEIEEWQNENLESGKKAAFNIDTIDLETKLVMKKEKGVQGGIKIVFIPVTIGGKANFSSEQVHTLTMKLSPKSGYGELSNKTEPYNRQKENKE